MTDENLMVYLSIVIPCGFSILGSLSTILIYIKFERLRCFASLVILILSILSLCGSISQVIPVAILNKNSEFCKFQGAFVYFFNLCTLFWLTNISVIIYIESHNSAFDAVSYSKWSLVCIMILAFSSTSILFFLDYYKGLNGQCWIGNQFKVLRFAAYYIPLWVCIMIITVLFFRTSKTLEENVGSFSLVKRLKVYPFIMVMLDLPITVLRLIQDFGIEPPIEYTMISAGLFMLDGFFNFLVFGYTENVRRVISSKNTASLILDGQ